MLGHVLFGFGYATLMSWMVYRVLSPAPAIWRGDASRVPIIPNIPPEARTYLPYALWFTMVCGGTGLMALFAAVDTLIGPALLFKVVARSGLYLFFAGLALLPVHLFAYCLNRPRILITPAWRQEVGPFIAIWQRLRDR